MNDVPWQRESVRSESEDLVRRLNEHPGWYFVGMGWDDWKIVRAALAQPSFTQNETVAFEDIAKVYREIEAQLMDYAP